MITRCDNCGGKFDKDEAWEMDHCGGVYEEHCEYCVEMLQEEREEREWNLWQEKVRQWDDEDEGDDVAEDLSEQPLGCTEPSAQGTPERLNRSVGRG